jgi:TRAP-type mannitol/chloroaromatic compound transport system permease small subunit
MQRLAEFSRWHQPRHRQRVRWLALLMVLVQFAIVVGRYVFGVNSIAAQESVLYMHASAVHAWRGLHAAGRQACPR